MEAPGDLANSGLGRTIDAGMDAEARILQSISRQLEQLKTDIFARMDAATQVPNATSTSNLNILMDASKKSAIQQSSKAELAVPERKEQMSEEVERAHEEVEDHHALMLREGNGLGSVFSADNDLEKPAYHVEDFYWQTGINQKIARSSFFANFTVGVVTINAVYIGFDSDYNNSTNIYNADAIFQVFSQFFCLYFTWELVVRFLAFENKHNCYKDGWFKFDVFLVSTMILDTWILMPALSFLGGVVQIPTQPLRMLRLFKLTRMARLMKAFPELVTMIKGLVRSMRAISSSMILVTLMVYVWSIMMHMLLKEEEEFNEVLWDKWQLSFSTMTNCIWTLFVSGTLMLDNAGPLMSSLLFSSKLNYMLAGWAFLAYTMMSALCILQMLIGILCEVVSEVKTEETNANAIGLMKQELLKSLKDCVDSDDRITQAQLMKVMDAPRCRALMKRLRINYPFFLALQKGAYAKPNAPVPIKDVLELMVMSRGENVATVESMAGALVSIINELSNVKVILESDLCGLEARLANNLEVMQKAEEHNSIMMAKIQSELEEEDAAAKHVPFQRARMDL